MKTADAAKFVCQWLAKTVDTRSCQARQLRCGRDKKGKRFGQFMENLILKVDSVTVDQRRRSTKLRRLILISSLHLTI